MGALKYGTGTGTGMQKCKDTWIPQADTPMAVTDNAANKKKTFKEIQANLELAFDHLVIE